MAALRLTKLDRTRPESGRPGHIVSCTNLTIPNLILIHLGPLKEQTVVLLVCGLQVLGSVFAFSIRYGVGAWVYGGERR